MRRLLDQMIRRPMEAFVSCVEMFCERVQAEQMFDGAVSRFIHIISRPSTVRHENEKEVGRSGISEDAGGNVSE